MASPDLRTQLKEFSTEAFRLESLPSYNVKGDVAEFTRYAEGELFTSWAERPWIQQLRDDTRNGKKYRRVRVLPSVVTPYLRFAMEWGYPYMQDAGEEILILEEGAAEHARAVATGDYWLIDDSAAFRMEYEQDGTFIGSHFDADSTDELVALKNDLIKGSVPLRDYLARFRSVSVHVPRRD